MVLDILRHVLTACNLSSFSLVDCCQSLLGRRLEVLPPSATAHLATDSSTSESQDLPAKLPTEVDRQKQAACNLAYLYKGG